MVNSTGAIRTIRQNCPQAILGVSVGERVATTLANSPDFDTLIPRPKARDFRSKCSYIFQLRKNRFDAAIILDEAGSQVRNAAWGGIKLLTGVAEPGAESRFQASVFFDKKAHDSRDQYDNLLRHLGFANVSDRPVLYPSDEDLTDAARLVDGLSRPLVAVHPGASERTRRWIPERFGAVAAELARRGVGVVITGSPQERELCEAVASASGVETPVLAGELSILGFAALASQLSAVVVGDTGPMHIAAAMGTPVVVPYGPTYPELTGPYGKGHKVVQGACSCIKRDWTTCTYECMTRVTVEAVVRATLEAIDTSPTSS